MAQKPKPSRRIVSKEAALRFALKDKRKVLWKDKQGSWHAATDRRNTPHWATETEDLSMNTSA